MGIHEQFFNIETTACKKYGENTIVFMQCGSFFETYGYKKNKVFKNPAYTEYSRICDFCMKEKKLTHKGYGVWMIGFPDYCLDKYVAKMTQCGYTIVVWVQSDDPIKIRYEKCVCTPGTDFSGGSKDITNYSMCLWLKKSQSVLLNKEPEIICGMSAVDILTGDTHVFEYREKYFHNPTTFDEIERFYSSYNPKEIFVLYENSLQEINDILQFSQIDCKKIHLINIKDKEGSYYSIVKNCENQQYITELLHTFYAFNDYHVFAQTYRLDQHILACQAFCFHLNFISSCDQNLVKKIKPPLFDNSGDRLILGNHSLKQLNIIPNQQHRGRLSSVVTFLNKCATPMGKRKLRNILIQPISDSKSLRREYDIIEHVLVNYDKFYDLFSILKEINDIERLFRKIILCKVAPAEISQLYQNLKNIIVICKKLNSDDTINSYLNDAFLSKNCLKIINFLDDFVNISQASEISSLRFEKNIFKRGKFENVDLYEKDHQESTDKLDCTKGFLEKFLIKYKGKRTNSMIRYHQTDKNGLFLSMTANRAKILQEELKKYKNREYPLSYISNYTQDKKTILFNPYDIQYIKHTKSNLKLDSKLLSNFYHSIFRDKENLKEELKQSYKEFMIMLQEFHDEIQDIVTYVTKLDVVITKAIIAKQYNYCKPTIDVKKKSSFLKATELRHPLIELLQQDETYVPNDIDLGCGVSQRGILLYGTNAVGKSSLIRSIGIAVIMAQAGMYVPATSFTFKPYTSIFTRILGNDNLFKGLSTYAVEMSELRTILNNADKNSLVLGDELCSGTESISATCIFMSGVIKLHEMKSSFIFATHFHEITRERRLKVLKSLSFKHMEVIYDEARDCLIYNRKLQDGPGNNMYGLEVCRSLHLPDDFLDLANTIRNERYSVTNVLSKKKSRYNKKKLKGDCELCGEKGVDIHHLKPQQLADKNGFIGNIHKNHKANIINICKQCHLKETKNNTIRRKTKTTQGFLLLETSAI
jgi:DNA mismatch repair protein MutS